VHVAFVPGALSAYLVISVEDLELSRVRTLLLACFVLLMCCHALVFISAYAPVSGSRAPRWSSK
jgi:hypothetical protein